MRHLIISVVYAVVCLASFVIAKQLEESPQAAEVSKKNLEKEIKIEKKDNSSQSLTTFYPKPTQPL